MSFENTLIVGGKGMEETVLLSMFFHDFVVHVCKIFLGGFNKGINFSLEIVGLLMCLNLGNSLLQLIILSSQLLNSTLTHSNYIQKYELNQLPITNKIRKSNHKNDYFFEGCICSIIYVRILKNLQIIIA